MTAPLKSRTFKSGNSVAIRLPRTLGIDAGTEMTVREEHGRYIIEPVAKSEKIDLTGIYGSIPDLPLLGPDDRMFDERELDWEGKLLPRG